MLKGNILWRVHVVELNPEALPASSQDTAAGLVFWLPRMKADKKYHIIVFCLLGFSQNQMFCSQMSYCVYITPTLLRQSTWYLIIITWWKETQTFDENADYFSYRVTSHTPCPFSCVVSGWQRVRERLCVFVVPFGGEKQVAWRLKYWWVMINSCGWSEAHLNRCCVLWSWVLMLNYRQTISFFEKRFS